ncbi:MAG: hypothetical protein L6Q76_06485 [Polyangiaceae bacterium]|nr:hypothetical protein [Polyangiaceae bacterium]
MNDIGLVRRAQGARNVTANLSNDRPIKPSTPIEELTERLADEQRHYKVRLAVVRFPSVEHLDNVSVPELANRTRLAKQPLAQLELLGRRRDELHRDLTARSQIHSRPHNTHGALTNTMKQPIFFTD